MDKEHLTQLLGQLSQILAAKETLLGSELTVQLQERIAAAQSAMTNKDGLALGTSLANLVQAISAACLPGRNLTFTDQERPVWEALKDLTRKERDDSLRGLHLF
ncbi:hypothetical protein [Streptococcus oriscaviae]|uniref:Uncharacterized protein n=1 Tax=Streptococcus oriscaviae TaxID=2781599 RepID=A0ABX7YNY0_9STRE|nr:hypothetical protein [Streptococcus oriscaviae]QUE55049.1 hypothetical protein INT76_03985 [Streptococcus oriscaviae]